MKPKLILCLALVLSGGWLGCSNATRNTGANNTAAQIQRQVESLPQSHIDSFRVVLIEKPTIENFDRDSWLHYAPAPIAVRKYAFIPTKAGISFNVMFIFTDSTDHARNLLMRSEAQVQGMGKRSRSYGADELEIYDDWLTGRWQQTVVVVCADRMMPPITQEEWSSVMRIIESVTRERN